MLKVKRLTNTAILPTVGHVGEDIGYDLYADFRTANSGQTLVAGEMLKVTTGIAVQFAPKAGAIIGTRSSMANKRIIVTGGVIDAGYRGEIVVMLENLGDTSHTIRHGDKIAQLIQIPNLATDVEEVEELTTASRGGAGFGSTGQ